MNTGKITISEKGGVITVAPVKAAGGARTLTIWFDCNCPYCRRHWMDHLEGYLEEIEAGKLTLDMIPVAFLTEYSARAAMLLYSIIPYGVDVFFDAFHSIVWEGLPESQGNDDATVTHKLGEVYKEIIVPALNARGVDPKTIDTASQESYDKIKNNTDDAIAKGINGVPHIEQD
ncbi:MAG: thioredoxin domain-containing protein [Clostridiales Family XIII bacterium]|jgi:protein-disulfide isomerase|nr:thioredoxin domain-containing protein [Clostridiales Family XIII bacterium]